jgi:small subunit ribosomal protein S27Ae
MMSSPNASAKWSKYGVEDGKLVRKAEFCPTCGPGVFLAVHKDRKSCGRCGYTVKNE